MEGAEFIASDVVSLIHSEFTAEDPSNADALERVGILVLQTAIARWEKVAGSRDNGREQIAAQLDIVQAAMEGAEKACGDSPLGRGYDKVRALARAEAHRLRS